ncbi:helix-turn-helix domain-containing protein (plasmid) [Paroceanicella profunda]|uniref:Helix-turn-helix domain-containing protein n=1 Tax=Paroceanicella profunda TaxID=2579971 RepID=A0A5B8G3M4_9RHOB|nr:helix-turn-helix domain-containing protein [Paroceanicella profunda]QDL93999.1 helix-turn-helix domain-containing protein [Paroceanicella profunda]
MTTLENRSLDRGITLMEILARGGSCSLAELHAASGLPKSTIRRLLGTLIARRIVRRSLSDGRYRINITLPMSTGAPIPPGLAGLVDLSLPLALALTRRVRWPSDIHVVDGTRMQIVESTRPASPFHIYPGRVNRWLNIFGTASGTACLAAMSPEAVMEVHRLTEGDETWGLARFGLCVEAYLDILAATRARGYAIRLSAYLGETVFDDGLAAIAVPLLERGRPLGALTLIWPRPHLDHARFASEHLDALRDTAAQICAGLDRDTARTPAPAEAAPGARRGTAASPSRG